MQLMNPRLARRLARIRAFLADLPPPSLPFGQTVHVHHEDHVGEAAFLLTQEVTGMLRDRLTRLEIALLVKGVITAEDLKRAEPGS